MAKTYLQVVNDVLIKLREDTVTDFSDEYTQVIEAYVNTIKDEVEAAYEWPSMRYAVTFNSAASTRSYDLSDNGVVTSSTLCNEKAKLLYERLEGARLPMAFDVTDSATGGGYRLMRRPQLSRKRLVAYDNAETQAEPMWFSEERSEDGITISFERLPTAVRNYEFHYYIPQDELTDTTTEVLAPSRPIILGAYWLAAQERGEELGINSNILHRNYEVALNNAVALYAETDEMVLQET